MSYDLYLSVLRTELQSVRMLAYIARTAPDRAVRTACLSRAARVAALTRDRLNRGPLTNADRCDIEAALADLDTAIAEATRAWPILKSPIPRRARRDDGPDRGGE